MKISPKKNETISNGSQNLNVKDKKNKIIGKKL